jgi:hypothetical protein
MPTSGGGRRRGRGGRRGGEPVSRRCCASASSTWRASRKPSPAPNVGSQSRGPRRSCPQLLRGITAGLLMLGARVRSRSWKASRQAGDAIEAVRGGRRRSRAARAAGRRDRQPRVLHGDGAGRPPRALVHARQRRDLPARARARGAGRGAGGRDERRDGRVRANRADRPSLRTRGHADGDPDPAGHAARRRVVLGDARRHDGGHRRNRRRHDGRRHARGRVHRHRDRRLQRAAAGGAAAGSGPRRAVRRGGARGRSGRSTSTSRRGTRTRSTRMRWCACGARSTR